MHPANQSTWAMALSGFVGIGMPCRRLRVDLFVLRVGWFTYATRMLAY